MAQVAPKTKRHIDILLGMAMETWSSLPETERTIDEWDPVDRSIFLAEWPLEERRLEMLQDYAASGAMTESQLARYSELQKLVAQNRPVVDRLFEGWITVAESRRRQGLEP
jgi:hypothetical protein